jgi:hypothetical protein
MPFHWPPTQVRAPQATTADPLALMLGQYLRTFAYRSSDAQASFAKHMYQAVFSE